MEQFKLVLLTIFVGLVGPLLPSAGFAKDIYDNWGFDKFVQNSHGKALFQGELKDDDGPFQYGDNHPTPVICGLIETKDTVEMVGSWNPEIFLPDWKDRPRFWPRIVAAIKSLPEDSVTVIHEENRGLPNQKITVDKKLSRVIVEYSFPDDGSNSFPNEKTVMIINFRDEQPVGFEKRFYLSPEKMTKTHKGFAFKKYPSRQRTDETGRGYFMEYKCENDVTS